MSIMFNVICVNEEMLPKYTYFKLHDPAAHKYNKVLIYTQNLYHFRNISSFDDGSKLGRKYLGNS